MSAAVDQHDVHNSHDGHEAAHEHPSDAKYIQIALILGVITAVEVAAFYIEDTLGGLLMPSLLVMMAMKFFIVVAWFMHLRFDIKVFTILLVAGLILAVGVYSAAMSTFEFFA
ncbi:MAG: cytochrome C oxidase subunit IV family protein [Acidimicrobiales bacterium]